MKISAPLSPPKKESGDGEESAEKSEEKLPQTKYQGVKAHFRPDESGILKLDSVGEINLYSLVSLLLLLPAAILHFSAAGAVGTVLFVVRAAMGKSPRNLSNLAYPA